MHAEAVLLVDHRQREIAEGDVVLEQRVGADEEIDLARREPFQGLRARRPRSRPVRIAASMPAAAASGAIVA